MARAVATVLLAVVLAGCASAPEEGPDPTTPSGAFVPCLHPWPCADGSEWPADLAGPFDEYETRGFTPTINVHGTSHVVLPVVDGTLSGAPPLPAYPPRPFA